MGVNEGTASMRKKAGFLTLFRESYLMRFGRYLFRMAQNATKTITTKYRPVAFGLHDRAVEENGQSASVPQVGKEVEGGKKKEGKVCGCVWTFVSDA